MEQYSDFEMIIITVCGIIILGCLIRIVTYFV